MNTKKFPLFIFYVDSFENSFLFKMIRKFSFFILISLCINQIFSEMKAVTFDDRTLIIVEGEYIRRKIVSILWKSM